MSEPQAVREYLAALNASLEVGLRSRRRILFEVCDHLSQAAMDEWRRGASPDEAVRRAIAAFGSPEEVAARFEAGFISALDRRLALGARRLHRWTARRPSRVPVVWIALGALAGGVLAALGASFGPPYSFAAAFTAVQSFLMPGLLWWLMCIVGASCPSKEAEAERRRFLPLVFAFSMTGGYLAMVTSPLGLWDLFVSVTLVYMSVGLAIVAAEGAARRAARSYPGVSGEARDAWSADHPWRSALADVAPLPLGMELLVLLHPGPGGGLRIAVSVLVAVLVALALAVVRLEQGRREKDAYQNAYEGAT